VSDENGQKKLFNKVADLLYVQVRWAGMMAVCMKISSTEHID
jgi:hypothetical protein